MENDDKQFWYFLIEGILDDKTGAFANFYSYGSHCGEALHKTIEIAKEEGFKNPNLIETTRLDFLENFEIPDDAIKVNIDTYMLPSLNTYELNKDEYIFTPPVGVAFDTNTGEFDQDLIKECFVAFDKNDEGIYELELVIDKKHLTETFVKAFDFLPSLDAFWLYIAEHWNEGNRELWASKELDNKLQVIEFLKDYHASTIENGFLDIVVNSQIGETNLILTEHKKLQLFTKSETVFKNSIKRIKELGIVQTKDFYNIEFGYYHWHYRPVDSLDLIDFKEMLIDNDFENIELKE